LAYADADPAPDPAYHIDADADPVPVFYADPDPDADPAEECFISFPEMQSWSLFICLY
jgi:hypothetical protein